MTTTNSARLSAHGALFISLVSLGLAAWAVGCDRQPKDGSDSNDTAEPASPKTEPRQKAKPKKTIDPKSTDEKAKGKSTDTKPTTGKTKQSDAKPDGIKTTSLPKLRRLVVTTGVEKREPVKVDALLAGESPIYAFMELANESQEDQYVVVTFEREDDLEVVGHIKLKVPAEQPRWRTWGRTRMIQDAGPWVAVVRTPEGRELAREPFDVSAS
jgi:hypothetical protein